MKSTALLYRLSSLIAASWLAGATVFAARFENNLERNFPVSAGGKLVLQADQGSCEVIPVQTGEVQVRVLRRVEKGSKAQADEWFANHEVTFMTEGKTVSVIARKKKNLSPFPTLKGSYLEVRYEIRVPNSFNLDLNTSGGDIRIGELDGSVRARTSSGLIQLQRASGAVDVADSGGNIILGQIGGNLVAHTSSGSIEVEKLNGSGNLSDSGGNILVTDAEKGVVAKTSSGAITLKSVKGGVEASDSGGDITIDVAGGGVAASTSSGSIIIGRVQGQSLDLKNYGGDIRIEAAAGNVKARTSSGSISIKAAQGTVQAVDSGGDIKIGEAGEVTAST